ncbi:MAG: hypothetical protein ACREBO_06570 [Novosphingobium sp.]
MYWMKERKNSSDMWIDAYGSGEVENRAYFLQRTIKATHMLDLSVLWGVIIPISAVIIFFVGRWVARGFGPEDPAGNIEADASRTKGGDTLP